MLYRRLLVDAIKKNEAGELVMLASKRGPARPRWTASARPAGIDEYWKESDETRPQALAWAA